MGDKKNSKKEKLLLVVDIFFVMVLCFAVLLVTMICQNAFGGVDVTQGYRIDPVTVVLVIAAIAGYLFFLVVKSRKELKEIVDAAYGK